jgi:hypothetical protein
MDITFFFLAALAVGFYMAWNIGANDVANSMGTSVGSKAITLRQAVIIAGIFELTGAVFFGKHVTKTIRKGIVDPSQISDPSLVAIGAFSALFAAALWLTFATWKGLPRLWHSCRRLWHSELGQDGKNCCKLGDITTCRRACGIHSFYFNEEEYYRLVS